MKTDDLTLAGALELGAVDASKLRARIQARKGEISANVSVSWRKFERILSKKLLDRLEIKVADIWLEAIGKSEELLEVIELSKSSPDEVNEVTLLEHEIDSSREAKGDVSIDGKPAGTVTFNLTATLKISGAIVTIQAGRISEASLAQLAGSVTLRYKDWPLFEGEIPILNSGLRFEFCD